MPDRASNSTSEGPVVEGHVLKQLVQTLRGDLNLLSNEARKKYPAVREVWECGNRVGCAWECLFLSVFTVEMQTVLAVLSDRCFAVLGGKLVSVLHIPMRVCK